MPEALRVINWSIPQWGGATSLTYVDVPPGMVVVHGRNETGKSSLAGAIAWLLAGPGNEADLHHLGPNKAPLHATLQAELANKTLSIEVRATVPAKPRDAKVNETFTADIDGSDLTRSSLQNRLGGIDLKMLRRYYYVGSEDIHRDHQERSDDADDSLSTHAMFGGLNPFKESETRDTEGHKSLGKPRGQVAAGSGQDLANSINSISQEIREARNAKSDWHAANEAAESTEKKHRAAEVALQEAKDHVRTLNLAINATPLHHDLQSAEEDLADASKPTGDQLKLTANEAAIRGVLELVSGSQQALSDAQQTLRNTKTRGDDWSDLFDVLDLSDETIESIRTADSTVATRRQDRDDRDAALARLAAAGSSATPTPPQRKDAGWLRRTSALTAVGLSAAAVLGVLGDRPAPAAVLGFLAVVALTSLRFRRPDRPPVPTPSDGLDDRVREDAAEAGRRLESAIERRTQLVSDAGVPTDQIRKADEGTARRFDAVKAVRDGENLVDDLKKDVANAEGDLTPLIPVGVEPPAAEATLNAALSIGNEYDEAVNAVKTAQQQLRELLGGTDTEAHRLLGEHDRPTLEDLLEQGSKDIEDLQTKSDEKRSAADEARSALLQIQDAADLQTPLLAYEDGRSRLRDKVVTGLANRLVSQILNRTAEAYAGDNQSELVEIANDLARSIGDGWMQVRLNPQSNQLTVLSATGEIPVYRLATGARSVLALCFRLAAIRTEAEKLQVLLPVILDDPLVHVDDQRRHAAFSVLNRFAEDHQVLYFTCHETHAEEAKAAGAHRVELRAASA